MKLDIYSNNKSCKKPYIIETIKEYCFQYYILQILLSQL